MLLPRSPGCVTSMGLRFLIGKMMLTMKWFKALGASLPIKSSGCIDGVEAVGRDHVLSLLGSVCTLLPPVKAAAKEWKC